MSTPDPVSDTGPTDEQLTALLGAADKDAPPPDRDFLDRLRTQTEQVFQTATSTASTPSAAIPTSLWKRMMLLSSVRYVAAATAAVLVIGLVVARWLNFAPAPTPHGSDEQFVIADTLVDDGRIGTVTDAQGVVSVKPVLHERWSPVSPRLVLKPGDWVRTDSRGANAVALKLLKATQVIVGPHSTLELTQANEIHVLAGEVEVTAADDAPIELIGPDKQKLTVKGKQFYRVEKDKLVRIEKEPLWLQGFKGTTANESLGSLVALVDGRNVPLTVGYHRVTVDVRDQIARTVIEESFINRTPGVLEGVFHFPLPQDASISGFGMWIGDQLVEADIVEKQRAREIYETILRERRDPGLLEWSGGNIFKARVFPIPANSEKRIRISYTQVLPLQGNRYRYSYALNSELLKQHPLRELTIDVKVNSATPLKSVSSPTHAVRAEKTEHSGHVEFSAQEYAPSRDFEAVVEVENRPGDVVVIPHRRGDDGYFMVQFTPPGSGGDWQRPLVPNGEPLKLLVLADTSASMDRAQRAAQSAVLNGLFNALTSKDTLNVAMCDVNCDWIFEKPVAATSEHLAAVRNVLEKRVSLGWTDLDRAFAAAMKFATPGTHVVYIGDGIVTTGDADPVAFAKRLHRLYDGKAGTFHAVATGSSFEPAVLKAIASLGGGSVYRVSGEQGPQAIALALLNEMATPALRNLKVEFTGIRTARVYPEELPNVPPGTQQILLGRYLPEGKDQSGEIVVTGTLGDKPVRYTSKVTLQDAESGNSFIPRLWARMHLDALLEQGTSPTIKQDIIALSEEYGIITPYTSFLVLENDGDRERFAVKRRFQMRDGEKIFAAGRDNANFELKQKQMQRAGDYRTALRRVVIQELQNLGRDARMFQERSLSRLGRTVTVIDNSESMDLFFESIDSSPSGAVYSGRSGFTKSRLLRAGGGNGFYDDFGLESTKGDSTVLELDDRLGDDREDLYAARGGKDSKAGDAGAEDAPFDSFPGLGPAEPMTPPSLPTPLGFKGLTDLGTGLELWEGGEWQYSKEHKFGIDSVNFTARMGRVRGRSYATRVQWIGPLFPLIPAPGRQAKEPKSTWPAAAIELSRSLLRTDALAKLKGGIVIDRQDDGYYGRRHELSTRSRRLDLVSPASWLVRTSSDGGPVAFTWCDAKELGVYNAAFLLGQVRASNAFDLRQPPLQLFDDSLVPLHVSKVGYTASVEKVDAVRAMLILKDADRPEYETRYLIDTQRHVVLSIESRHKNVVGGTTKFSDFVEIGGSWWATRIEFIDDKGERNYLSTQTVTEVAADKFKTRVTEELAGKDKVLFLHHPIPKLADAKTAAAAGKGTFEQHVLLTLHFAATQQWTRALEHLQQCEKLAAGKQGMRWLNYAFLTASRRHEELRKLLLAEATALVDTNDPAVRANDYFLAEHLFGLAGQSFQTNEMLALSDRLEKLYARQPAYRHALQAWRSQRISFYQQAGQPDKVLALSKTLAVDYPQDVRFQYQYAQHLANSGDFTAAYAWLDRVLVPEAKWEPSEEESLRSQYATLLQQQGRYRDEADYLGAWLARNPEVTQPYGQYLTALIRSNQAAKAETLAAQWLRDGLKEEVPNSTLAKLQAAIAFATGQGYNLYTNIVEERWHTPLADAILFFARHDEYLSRVNNILQTNFRSTDAAHNVRKTLAGILLKESGTLSPERVIYYVDWAWSVLETDDWKKLAAVLRQRWDGEKKPALKDQLGQALARILGRLSTEEYLSFLRTQLKQAADAYRGQYARQLFDALLEQSWTPAIEDEAFSLLVQLGDSDIPEVALFHRVAALYRLTDAMLAARRNAQMRSVEHPEKLTRTELKKKQDEFEKIASEGLSERLRREALKHAKPFANWLVMERVWLEVLLERDVKQVVAPLALARHGACWNILESQPVQVKPEEEGSLVGKYLDGVLRHRVLTTLMNLAARKGADPALVERLLKYVDKQMKEPDVAMWRAVKFQLLIALDRPQDLEKELSAWIAGPDPDNRWRIALGYLLAERGRVSEAIKLFEAVESADELGPREYRSLADWYLVENRRAEHDKSRSAIYKTTDEYTLSRMLGAYLHPWQVRDGHLPTQLDAEILLVFKVLFEKSGAPQNYLHALLQFYQASRDFRLLSILPDGVLGQTAGKVYPFLQGMQTVLGEIRDEAAADELVARIAVLRATAKSAIDQRALDMLELLVERRAAELQNQAGPHAAKALAALKRAFKHEWSPGEPRLMADFLAGLHTFPQDDIAAVQLLQLETLHRDSAKGSFDRLHIALRFAETLDRYAHHADAMDRLQAALSEFQEANNGILPTSANDALTMLASFTESARQYSRGEKLLLAQLTHPVHAGQRNWLIERLNDLYLQALANNGDVSLGSGVVLYKAVEAKLVADLASTDQNHRARLLGQFTRLYRTAHIRKIMTAVADLKDFAFKRLPPIVTQQTDTYNQIVIDVAYTLKELAGYRDGITFLLDRIDDQPDWLRYTNQNAWSQYSNTLAEWRHEAKGLGDLAPRLLKFVVAELKRDLRAREPRNRVIYRQDYNYFWKEKVDDFAAAAEEVLAERKQSSDSVEYIADYLFRGLGREKRAIDVLYEAHRQKVLSDSGQWQLVDYLHRTERFAESIPLLIALMERNKEDLHYRTKLMHAYYQTKKQAELLALLKETDAFFHQNDRWNEGAMAALAGSCLENHLDKQSVAYYEELIPLYQRSHPRQGVGDGSLAMYYSNAASAYVGLSMTKEAVDKASGAVVCWGPTHQQRKPTLDRLVDVLVAAPDLPGYAATLDKESLQSAIVRKAIGQAYVRKNDCARAIPQFRLAAELQPNDAEIYEALIACYDKLHDREGAVRQLLEAVELSRRDLKLFEQLGRRLAELNQPVESERAYTSIVEMQSNESESHELLAEVREKQNRWPEAMGQWERVAALRALEPTGLLRLAAAQVHEHDWKAAGATLQKLQRQSWPDRFNDVTPRIRELQDKVNQGSKP